MPRRTLRGEEPLDVGYCTRPDDSPAVAGLPLGGLGTGSFELHPDGSFREWQIFNNWGNNPVIHIWEHWPSFDLPGAFFAIRVSHAGAEPVARILEQHPLFGFPGIQRINYQGEFPVCSLRYSDPELPAEVELEAFPPFVPHDAELSSTPAACLLFKVRNPLPEPAEIALAFSMENPYGSQVRVMKMGERTVMCLDGIGPGGDSPSGICAASLSEVSEFYSQPAGDPEDATHGFWQWFRATTGLGQKDLSEAGKRGAVVARVSLAAGESAEVPFILTWYFPDHYADRDAEGDGPRVGHWYAARFGSAVQVAEFVIQSFHDLRGKVFAWRDTVYRNSLPKAITVPAGNVLSLMVKSSWRTQDGRFAMYESFQCPARDPLHVRAPGTFALSALFPELEQHVLRRFAGFQFKSGRVPEQLLAHMKGVPLAPDGERARELADVAPCFVIMAARSFIATGDSTFLHEIWPAVKAALTYQTTWDHDGDGLPDGVGARTTYDVWNMGDCVLYVCTLWLAALQAGAYLAGILGDDKTRAWCEAHSAKARASIEERLWNGEFYSVAVSGDERRDCTIVDGLVGAWYIGLLGLPPILPEDRVDSTVQTTLRLNAENSAFGATTCVGRNGERDFTGFYENDDRFATAIWPPTTWVLASFALLQGKVDGGLRLADKMYHALADYVLGGLWYLPDVVDPDTGQPHRAAFARYLRSGSAWTMLAAAAGFAYNAYEQRLVFIPRINAERFEGPFATAQAWGRLASEQVPGRSSQSITVISGRLVVKRWEAPAPIGIRPEYTQFVGEDGLPLHTLCRVEWPGNRLALEFEPALEIRAGQTRGWSVET